MPLQFPKDFIFGSATSSFQVEGAWNADGKGPSIWDEFTREKGKIRNGERADTACDHYHRYPEDIALMKRLGLQAYRYSVSWPRIYPEGTGTLNPKGMDFYNRLTDAVVEAGITPLITLFHWDLPLALQKRYKGFENRDMADVFAEYCAAVVRSLGDRAKRWITVNEPFEYAAFGHFLGYHAPGKKSLGAYFRVMHNLLRGHGMAMRAIRSECPDAEAGITVSVTPVHPATESAKDAWSAGVANDFMNHITLSPLLKGRYPEALRKRMRLFFPKIREGDMDLIKTPADFTGINLYSREKAMHKWYIPFLRTWTTGQDVPDSEYEKDGRQFSSMGWEVYPDAMYETLKMMQDDYGNPPVYITENGGPFTDRVVDGTVADPKRIRYMQDYLEKVRLAIGEGADVRAYFYWSLLDNFEWAEGFSKRFGLIHVDHETQERIIKASGLWYRDLIHAQKRGDQA